MNLLLHPQLSTDCQMNRIYQGKVTAVEIPAPHLLSAAIPFSASDGGKVAQPDEVFTQDQSKCRNQNPSQPLDLDVLWRHHELFQDAVNF